MRVRTTARTVPDRTLKLGKRLPGLTTRLVLEALEGLTEGCLELDWSGERRVYGDARSTLRATVTVHDVRFFGAIALRGSVGAGESYMEGWWSSDELLQVVRILVRNQDALASMETGLAALSRPFLNAYHAVRRNHPRGARKNIAEHYDLSNEFFGLFLDESMTYSCALFEDAEASLREAQIAKLDRLCQLLDLRPGDRLVEIGTGWGSLAVHAAGEYGCHVTTTTISERQRDYAARRFAAAGLTDRIELLGLDYRDLRGQFDKLVSVEMIEAVGHRYYGAFFETCARLLKPEGLMVLQAITIADRHYDRARQSVDFIQRYIFPGACIPSVTALLSAATKHSDLTLADLADLTPHYARTLSLWRENLLGRREEVLALGLDERFLRMWEFYLVYCEGGFRERHIGDVHMLFTKPRAGLGLG